MNEKGKRRETGEQINKSVTCPNCKTVTDFPPYVFAHWRERLTFSCDCGTKIDIVAGVIWKVKTPKGKITERKKVKS